MKIDIKFFASVLIVFLFIVLPIFSIDWPQDEVASDSFYSYFGQYRGGGISTSLVFASPSEIKAVDDGVLLAVINDYSDGFDFFPSALGTAVVLSHEENLLTVYGNIDAETFPENVAKDSAQTSAKNRVITSGTVFGTSGNSAWQDGASSLEFQVIDTKAENAINPRSLMPRTGKELSLEVGGVVLVGRSGDERNLLLERVVPAGLYRVYRNRQAVSVPYKTRVSVNGTTVDEISYGTISQTNMDVFVSGRKQYPLAALYPNETRQLVGEANIAVGRNVLTVTLSDILGSETSLSWTITGQ